MSQKIMKEFCVWLHSSGRYPQMMSKINNAVLSGYVATETCNDFVISYVHSFRDYKYSRIYISTLISDHELNKIKANVRANYKTLYGR